MFARYLQEYLLHKSLFRCHNFVTDPRSPQGKAAASGWPKDPKKGSSDHFISLRKEFLSSNVIGDGAFHLV